MNKSIFAYSTYISFLKDWIGSQPRNGHGLRLKMAELLGRQSVYISQVLHGNADLSSSQAQLLAEWMGLSEKETHFLLLLVQHARSDTQKLAAYYSAQLARVHEENLNLQQRVKGKVENIQEKDRLRYYSAWLYPAIHLLTAIPDYQNRLEIARRLQLPQETVSEVLEFLLSLGLVEQKGDRFLITSNDIFLGNDSALISRHHMNWRIRSMQSFEREKVDELHYSTAAVISEKDAVKIKLQLLEAIEKNRKLVKDSGNEELFCISLDFFRV
jgi:uncharacterized protein (TIGR02147 family)